MSLKGLLLISSKSTMPVLQPHQEGNSSLLLLRLSWKIKSVMGGNIGCCINQVVKGSFFEGFVVVAGQDFQSKVPMLGPRWGRVS